jgi:hypothetical protein
MDAVQAKIGDVDFLFQVSDNINLKNMTTKSQMPERSGQTDGGATGKVGNAKCLTPFYQDILR